ncbi:carboxypeptidase-like regulatory domain-containing protein [Mucilaginibacter corticis]|uniref:Carboxypeptidase-like regulatory domain-containing protein n=1 Tax=Mucilaginibacter corticis TaxID=2597670 RepID=A0A556MW42_9SPHI|nr:carboxypeptidase-like regulatory domain-containing protein [Mucilaginibacter corticis]TSJ44141.1 carboxypeptidase-like regulatory domain-containing protein [Mucilaginibacter corticis]
MKHLACRLLFILFVFLSANVMAQAGYTLSGTVTDENNQPVKGTTVFISGSQQITSTNKDGQFTFGNMGAGNYLVSTNMLGYAASSQDVTIYDKSVDITISLKVKPITLKEVKIGSDKNWAKHYALFKDQFLGTSADAKNCTILNPEIINFSTQKIPRNIFEAEDHLILKADADDFLIIENKKLGYRIKYLLKTFEHNSANLHTFYDGDNSFEEMDGTADQKKVWAQNRLAAYKGSLMHFLRAVYANTVLKEGFITNQLFRSKNQWDKQNYVDPNPVRFDTLVTVINSSHVSFKFKAINIAYDPKKAARLLNHETTKEEKQEEANARLFGKSNSQTSTVLVTQTNNNSQLLLYLKEAVIDARGSVFTGYIKTFLIRGEWANKRIGDQLPFEYQPPNNTN